MSRLKVLESRKFLLETLFDDTQDWVRRKRINKMLWYVNRKIKILSRCGAITAAKVK